MTNSDSTPPKAPWGPKIRVNVLALMLFGYGLVGVMFVYMVQGGSDPATAFESVEAPLMALVGGSLTISKDLI